MISLISPGGRAIHGRSRTLRPELLETAEEALSDRNLLDIASVLHHFGDHEVIKLIEQLRQVACGALIVLDLERHWLAYHFLPLTQLIFGWGALTDDGPVSVAAGFRSEELAVLAHAAGCRVAAVQRQ